MIENLSSLNEFRLSESILQEHLRNKRNDAHAHLLMSSVYSSWSKFNQARSSFESASKYKNENTDTAFLDYQNALLLGVEGKSSESISILKKLSNHPSLKIAAKANRALLEIEKNSQKAISPWLERRHVNRRELNELSMQRLRQAQAEESASQSISTKPVDAQVSTVAMDTNALKLGEIAKVSSRAGWWPLNFTVNSSVNVGSTYDSNILQIPDKLAPLVSDKSGIVHSGSVQLGASSGFGPGNLSATAAVSTSINANQDASNLNSFNGSNNLQWTADETSSGLSWGITNSLTGSFMNTDGYKLYNWANSTGLVVAKRLNESFGMDVSVNGGQQKFPGVAVINSNDDRNGPTMGAAVNLNGTLGELGLGTGFNWSRQSAKGINFKTTGSTVSVSASRPVSLLKSQIALNGSATKSQFPDAERSRTDSQLSSSVTWSFPVSILSEKTKLSFSGSGQSSDSSLPDAAFTKYTISAAVDHAF
jgi:tetratricopeptide (TPR) repeat protein